MTKQKKATIRDVANAANVSIATISRVLNKSSIPSDEMRKHVESVIKKLNYIPQLPGRKPKEPKEPNESGSLGEQDRRASRKATRRRSRTSRTIGLLLSPALFKEFVDGEIYYARLLNGIYTAVAKHDCQLMVCAHDDERPLPAAIVKNQLDGLLINDHIPSAIQNALRERHPVVFIDSSLRKVSSSSVRPNFETAFVDIASYLWELGHRDIAMFVAADGSPCTPAMHIAYTAFFSERTYPTRVDNLCTPRAINAATHAQVIEAYVDELLSHQPRPTALLAEDVYATAICIEIIRRGLSVPDDLSIVGIYDSSMALHMNPRLTSYRFPIDEIGQASVEELLEKIADPARSSRQIFLDGELVVRDSVAPVKETNKL